MEGLDYKKQLLALLKSNKIDLSDLQPIDINSSEDETEEEKDDQASCNKETASEIVDSNAQSSSAVKEIFQTEFIRLQKFIDDELTATTAMLNTELEMLAKRPTVIGSSIDADMDGFIWKIRIQFEYENEHFSLPVQQVEHIEKLDKALFNEVTYQSIVSLVFY